MGIDRPDLTDEEMGLVASSTDPAQPQQNTEAENPEKTLGEQYIERNFYPHLELPEEMPAEILENLQNHNSYNAGVSERVWTFLRTGIGGLLIPSPEQAWNDEATYISNCLNGQEATLASGPNSSFGNNVLHIFRNNSTVAGMLIPKMKEMPFFTDETLADPVAAVEFTRNFLDRGVGVVEEWKSLHQQVLMRRKELQADPNKKEIKKETQRLKAELKNALSSESDDAEQQVTNAISISKRLEETDGKPYLAYIAEEIDSQEKDVAQGFANIEYSKSHFPDRDNSSFTEQCVQAQSALKTLQSAIALVLPEQEKVGYQAITAMLRLNKSDKFLEGSAPKPDIEEIKKWQDYILREGAPKK
jgi:hypothetical protein